MIQRKQSVYLLLAFVAMIACIMLPIGYFEPKGGGAVWAMTYFRPVAGQDVVSAQLPWIVAMLTCPLVLWALFAYKKRRFQARLCVAGVVLELLWYLSYARNVFAVVDAGETTYHPAFAACLPLVSLILLLMARKGILDDERLVRAADRIR